MNNQIKTQAIDATQLSDLKTPTLVHETYLQLRGRDGRMGLLLQATRLR